MIPYTELKGREAGKTAFILGAGPSLLDAYDSDLWHKINEHVVICVNSSILIVDWGHPGGSRYWVSNDSATRLWTYWKKVKSCYASKVIRDSWKKYFDEIPCFYVFSPRKASVGQIDYNDEEHLAYVSSVPTAIDLALQMGCKKIAILGCDHQLRKGKSHFWQLWPRRLQPTTMGHIAPVASQYKIFKDNMASYKALDGFAKYKNAKIYNCSLNSRIEVYDKISFEDFVNEKL
ncbi:MAG: hypothetical protein ACOC56_00635 [Atribacterota bacterium]